jgi:hypothetical protein
VDQAHRADEREAAPEKGDSTNQQYTRLSVNLNDEAANALRRVSKKRQVSITEAVRRAIAIYDLVEHELDAGSKVQIVDPSGHVRELFLL